MFQEEASMDVDSILNASDSDEDDLLLDEDDDGTAALRIRLEDILREDDEDDEEGEEVDETEGNFYQADDGNMKSLKVQKWALLLLPLPLPLPSSSSSLQTSMSEMERDASRDGDDAQERPGEDVEVMVIRLVGEGKEG